MASNSNWKGSEVTKFLSKALSIQPAQLSKDTPKQWIANVCASVIEDDFSQWVKD